MDPLRYYICTFDTSIYTYIYYVQCIYNIYCMYRERIIRPCESMGRGCKFKRKSQVVDWFQILSRGYDMISPGTYKTQENNGIHNRPNYRKYLLMLGFFHQQNHHHLVSLIWGLVPELRLSVFNQDFLQDQLLHDRILMYWRLTKVHKGILHLDFLLVLCSVYVFFRQFRPPNCSLGNQKKKKTLQPNGKRETSWHPLSACLRTLCVGRRGIWGIWVGSSRATPPMALPAPLPAPPAPWRARRRKAGACRRGELKDLRWYL